MKPYNFSFFTIIKKKNNNENHKNDFSNAVAKSKIFSGKVLHLLIGSRYLVGKLYTDGTKKKKK